MSRSKEPTIPFSSDRVMLDYFTDLSPKDCKLFDNSSPQIILNNSDEIHHPLSEKPIVTSSPFISKYLNPVSILRKTSSTGSSNQHITHETSNGERRPSAITFSNTDSQSVFFDALSYQGDHRPISPTIPRTNSNTNILSSIRKKSETKSRRPSMLSRISSAYTNKTATIPIDHVDFKKGYYLHEGVVLCAIVSKNQIKLEQQPLYHADKKLLKWKEYKAVITSTGYLELYKICDCKNSSLPMRFHFKHKNARYSIDLNPADNNILFQKAVLATKSKIKQEPPYFLSLLSAIDFSWSLTSTNSNFYFQSRSVYVSQQWYRSLYTCLPSISKKPFPKKVNLTIPELSTTIQLPLSELINEEDENVELSKVLDSALVLLNRNGTRPVNWNKNTLGLCWRAYFDGNIDWAIKPKDTRIEYLIEPRLIEKTHELQLRFYTNDIPPIPETPTRVEGYILDASSSRTLRKSNRLLYAVTMDHYLFLYENKVYAKKTPIESIFCFYHLKKANQTFPTLPPPESSTPRSAVGVIDLLKIKDIAEESCEAYDEEEEPEHVLHLDDRYLFQILNQPTNNWTERLEYIQEYYKRGQVLNQILQSSVLYVKNAKSKYATFEKRLCILTSNGDICVFKTSKHNSYEPPEFSLSLKDNVYIYSGETCCSYISGLLTCQPARLFENGEVIENHGENKPSQCCFVIHNRDKQYVLLARSQAQKDVWVQTICSFLKSS
ncbi:hypothetical protein BDF21DRAFT_415337 [Thamnidium elegans]|nr:hypothetical protein BDF21DRAFT_415337 [Thamnidium elegans]